MSYILLESRYVTVFDRPCFKKLQSILRYDSPIEVNTKRSPRFKSINTHALIPDV